MAKKKKQQAPDPGSGLAGMDWQKLQKALQGFAPTPGGFSPMQSWPGYSGGGDTTQKAKPAKTTSDPQSGPGNPLAQFLISKIPEMTYGEQNNPSPQWLQTMSQALSGMSPSDAQKVLSALPQNSPAYSQLETLLKPSSAQNLYGFDPLSMANIYQQVFSPAIKYAQQQYSGDIANYGKEMQQALKSASPQYQQAYAVSMPGLQEAMQMQAAGMQSQIAGGASTDALIQNLTNATNAAKSAQQYSSIAPYYQALIQQSQGGGLLGSTSSANPTTPSTATSSANPFQYGSPSSSQLGVLQAQQALMGLANMAATGQ
jgi:hypothetical protein